MALEDKTEAPTPRKRQEARKEGQVARSVELNSALVLLAALLLLKLTGPALAARMQEVATRSFTCFPNRDLVVGDVSSDLVRLLLQVGTAVAPLLLGVAVVGFVSGAVQVGLVISGKALQPKAERINPLSGIAKMFSIRSAMELAKSVAKIAIIGYIVYSFIRDKYTDIASLAGGDYLTTCGQIGQLTWELLFRAAMALLVIAGLDYMFQRKQLEKQLRMTKQEVKEDFKRTEGDPIVKSRIRQLQREMAQTRMMQEVPKADVVVTNPTRYAVALKYDADANPAPVVVAKGQRLVAQRIREIAEENGVPIVENVQLARALYASVDVGSDIPADLYQAVAEILAYVYRLSNRLAA